MKNVVFIALFLSVFMSCNQHQSGSSISQEYEEEKVFKSVNKDGKYTTDYETAQEIKSMQNTVENFTLLIHKKKFENLKAYQEFGDLMQMHIERIMQYCKLDVDTKNLLCKKLDNIKREVYTLHGDDINKSKEALVNINSYLSDIDSSFNY